MVRAEMPSSPLLMQIHAKNNEIAGIPPAIIRLWTRLATLWEGVCDPNLSQMSDD
jgi:hypothetical protein